MLTLARIIAICIMAASTSGASASTHELLRAVNQTGILQSNGSTESERRRIANSLQAYWLSFLNRIPRLSPAEEVWIKGEVESGDSGRLVAVLNRREGALFYLRQSAEGCVKLHGDVLSALGKNPNAEAKKWVVSLKCYLDAGSMVQQLFSAGLTTTDRWDNEFNMVMISLWHAAIVRIAGQLIVPN